MSTTTSNHNREAQPGGEGSVQPDAGTRQTLAFYAAYYTAVVAAVFSLVVAVLLVFDYSRRVVTDPLAWPEFQAMLAEAKENPQNEELKEAIRRQDVELRKAYFWHKRFASVGGWLLAIGLVTCVVAGKTASVLRRPMPQPETQTEPVRRYKTAANTARWAVGGLAAVLALGAALLGWHHAGRIPAVESGAKKLAAGGAADGSPADAGVPDPQDTSFPDYEEYAQWWPRFRGPDGSGISTHPNPPTEWDADSGENILWKVPVPLPGNNSPVVWKDRVFVTGADESQREVFCFDAESGKLLWRTPMPGTPQSTAEPPEVMADTGYAAPTTATDGRRVYAMFANGDVGAFDFAGNVVWSHSLGIPDNAYGHASSLATWQDLVLVQFDQGGPNDDKSKLIAYRGATGEVVWQVDRPVGNSWTTPLVVFEHEPPLVITCADPLVIAYNAEDGSELWRFEGTTGDNGPSPVFHDGTVYVGNEYSFLFALPADKLGELAEEDVLWRGEYGLPDVCSPLVTDELVLVVAYGYLTCFDRQDGEMLWEYEFEDADFSASPALAGGLVYFFAKEGACFLLEVDREGAEQVGQATLGEGCVTSPAFQPGRLYIRGKEHLFCIGTP